jgi:hypothetical protein
MSERNEPDPLETQPKDRAVALVKQAAGVLPGIGPAIMELFLDEIPNLRQDRIATYLRELEARVSAMEFRDRLRDPERLDLFEEGARQAARATTSERLERLANIVAFGINGDERNQIEAKRLLALMAAVDDDQIVILLAKLSKHRRDTEFREANQAVLAPVRAHMGSSQDDLDQSTIHELARAELMRLGLLRERYKKAAKGQPPELDEKTGRLKAQSIDITPLGRLLLRRLGLIEPKDY